MATSSRIQLQRLGVLDFYAQSPDASSTVSPRTPSPSGTSPQSYSLRANIFLTFDPSIDAAFLKVEAPVSLLNNDAMPSPTRAERTHIAFTRHAGYRRHIQLKVSLHIHPGQVTSLAFSRLPKLPNRLGPVYKHLSDRETLSLELAISSPPTLIIPKVADRLVPHTRSDLATLTVFQRITNIRTSPLNLTLYIPGTALSDAQASSICAGITRSTTAVSGHTKFDSLFGGLGAREVPPEQVAGIVDQCSPTTSPSTHASPPSYKESDSGQAPPVYDVKGKGLDSRAPKRPRQSTSSPAVQPSGEKGDGSVGQDDLRPQIQLLQQLLNDASSKISQLMSLNAEADKKDAVLRARLTEADAKVVELVEAATQYEYEASEGLDEYIDQRMEELRDELTSHMDDRYNFLGLDTVVREEMEEFVEEHIGAAMDDLRERLAGGAVRVILPEE